MNRRTVFVFVAVLRSRGKLYKKKNNNDAKKKALNDVGAGRAEKIQRSPEDGDDEVILFYGNACVIAIEPSG